MIKICLESILHVSLYLTSTSIAIVYDSSFPVFKIDFFLQVTKAASNSGQSTSKDIGAVSNKVNCSLIFLKFNGFKFTQFFQKLVR